jgi:hypothetical protein
LSRGKLSHPKGSTSVLATTSFNRGFSHHSGNVVFGHLLHTLADCPSVHVLKSQNLQNQQIKGSLNPIRGPAHVGMATNIVTWQRLYQMVRQNGAITDHTFEIEFLDPGLRAYAFTFG